MWKFIEAKQHAQAAHVVDMAHSVAVQHHTATSIFIRLEYQNTKIAKLY